MVKSAVNLGSENPVAKPQHVVCLVLSEKRLQRAVSRVGHSYHSPAWILKVVQLQKLTAVLHSSPTCSQFLFHFFPTMLVITTSGNHIIPFRVWLDSKPGIRVIQSIWATESHLDGFVEQAPQENSCIPTSNRISANYREWEHHYVRI